MTDTQYLERKIAESGKKKTYLAKRLGITYQSLSNKINNRSEFTVRQMCVLSDELGIESLQERDMIFCAVEVKNN